ncbi:unnamed protein product [Polarella glacialis]|uniref:Glucose-methanol-choline oxidoreductase N-terminal domain-containing protein n=1 Tax=Polarella glacialis TaxID=89957 RepID=A0A813HTA2_POLGL|nr:unnamed protein product [Polarella glacialis]
MRLPRGKMLGGSTGLNYMAYVRGHPNDYDTWKAGGADDWGYEDVLPFFKKSEDFAPHPDVKVEAEVHGIEGPLSVTHRDPELPFTGAFLRAAEQLDFEVGDYNGHAGRLTASRGIVGPHQFTIRNGQRCSAYSAFLEADMGARPNLTVATGAHASRVLLDEGWKAVGVEWAADGAILSATAAREVVLCAGAYMSPQLLLRSGVGPRLELEALGLKCLVDSPHVGKHLKDHLYLPIPFECPSSTALGPLACSLGLVPEAQGLFEEYMATGKGCPATSLYEASLFFSTGTRPEKAHTHDAQISWVASCYDPNFYTVCHGIVDFEEHFHVDKMFNLEKGTAILLAQLIQPESEGEVTLSGTGASDPPLIRHNYLTKPADVKAFVAICKQTIVIKDQMAKSEEMGEVLIPKNLASRYGTDLDSDELWEAWLRHYACTLYHPTSTCRIGDVVDPRCRVKGVRSLRVADASIMPDVVSGNTQAACVMIGEKVAAMIAEDNAVV